jgi:hypothetical protein
MIAKIAGPPKAVLRGRGGDVGEGLLSAHQAGRSIAKEPRSGGQMNPLLTDAFSDEIEKIALRETLRVGRKAFHAAVKGGTKLSAPDGVFQAERSQAVRHGKSLMKSLQSKGQKVHRARVKSPGSITAGGHKKVPDDLLGMQVYAKSPQDINALIKSLKSSGVEISGSSVKTRPGYHGVNIKGVYKGVPIEMQASPSRMSNAGQVMEHSLGYKVSTEAPKANRFDKWVGKKVAPRMVNFDELRKVHPKLDPSWVNEHKGDIEKFFPKKKKDLGSMSARAKAAVLALIGGGGAAGAQMGQTS